MKTRQSEPSQRTSAGLDLLNLVQRIFLAPEPCHTVTFAGVEAVNGSTSISMETARVLAAAVHQDVLLIDADSEVPVGPVRVFGNGNGYEEQRGLSTAMESDGPIRRYTRQADEDNLYLMQAGPPAGQLLQAGAMRAFLQRAQKEFPFVLIHSPALALSSDCVALGQAADGVVLVIEASRTRKGVAKRTLHELQAAGTTILGAVLSRTMQPIPAFLYGRL